MELSDAGSDEEKDHEKNKNAKKISDPKADKSKKKPGTPLAIVGPVDGAKKKKGSPKLTSKKLNDVEKREPSPRPTLKPDFADIGDKTKFEKKMSELVAGQSKLIEQFGGQKDMFIPFLPPKMQKLQSSDSMANSPELKALEPKDFAGGPSAAQRHKDKAYNDPKIIEARETYKKLVEENNGGIVIAPRAEDNDYHKSHLFDHNMGMDSASEAEILGPLEELAGPEKPGPTKSNEENDNKRTTVGEPSPDSGTKNSKEDSKRKLGTTSKGAMPKKDATSKETSSKETNSKDTSKKKKISDTKKDKKSREEALLEGAKAALKRQDLGEANLQIQKLTAAALSVMPEKNQLGYVYQYFKSVALLVVLSSVINTYMTVF